LRVTACQLLWLSAKTLAQSPNVVQIAADEPGWKDPGDNGSEAKPPNIEALAQGGDW
jgi:arylsulfatase A-like enzyme